MHGLYIEVHYVLGHSLWESYVTHGRARTAYDTLHTYMEVLPLALNGM